MNKKLRQYFSKIGSTGGKKSKRALTSEDALKMVLVREARRAFKKYYTSCFWSYNPNHKVTFNDISWIAEKLQKNGDLAAWKLSKKLCP